MSSIDERIVELQLKNQDFEKNAKVSIGTLNKLQNALNIGSTSKGLTELGKTANNLSFAGLSNSVENISSKFSALGVIGFTALQNITNSAISLGKKLTSNIFEPLVEGGKRRALNIAQAKFQIEGLKKDWDKLSDDIDYAVSGTAYGFDAAAKAAAQLSASGVEAGDAMKAALRGISGVAAMANSSYEDISPIFTTVAGQGKLMTMQLRQLEARGLNVAATLGEQLGKTEAEIRDMVSEGKINFEMFSKAMDSAFGEHAKDANKTFTGSLSNVKAALARIGQKFAEPVYDNLIPVFNALREKINDVNSKLGPLVELFSNFAKKVSDFVTGKINKLDLSFVTDLINDFINFKDLVIPIFRIIKEAFTDIFSDYKSFSSKIMSFNKKIAGYISDILTTIVSNKDKFKSIFKGFFAIFDIGKTLFMAFINSVKPLSKIFQKVGGGFLTAAAKLGDFIVKVDETIKSSSSIKEFFDTIFKSTGKLGEAFDFASKKAVNFISFLKEKFGKLKEIALNINEFRKGIVDGFRRAGFTFESASNNLFEMIQKIKERIANAFKNFDFKKFSEVGFFGFLAAIVIRDVKALKGLKKAIEKNNILKSIMSIFTGVKDGINTSNSILSSIKDIFGGFKGILESYQKDLDAKRLLKIAGAVAILAGAMFILSSIEPKRLISSIEAMSYLFIALFGSLKVFESNFDEKKMRKLSRSSGVFIVLAGAIFILSSAMKKLSKLSWSEVMRGIVALSAVCLILVETVKYLNKNEGKIIKGSGSLIVFAIAMNIFAMAFKKFGKLSWPDIGKSIVSMFGIVTLIAGFSKAMDKRDGKNMLKFAGSIAIIGAAMIIFAKSFKMFAGLDLKQIATALGSMLGVLTIITIFSALDKKIGNGGLLKTAASLVVIAIAMKLLSGVIIKFAALKPSEIAKGLITLAGALTIILLTSKFMPKTMILTAGALMVMAMALQMLAVAIGILGKLDIKSIGKAALVLVGAFVILGTAAAILTPLIPAMLGLAAVIGILGAACLAVGAGLVMFSAGLAALAIGGSASILALTNLITSILYLLPLFGTKLGEMLQNFILTTLEKLPTLWDSFALAIASLLDTIDKYMPQFMEKGISIVMNFLKGIRKNMYQITTTAVEIALEFINGISDKLPEIIDSGMNLVINFIDGLATALDNNTDKMLDACEHFIISLLKAMKEAILRGIENIKKAGKKLMESGFVQGLKDKFNDAKEWIVSIPSKIKDWILGKVEEVKDAGKNLIQGFINGIKNKSDDAVTETKDVGNRVVHGLRNVLEEKSPSKVAKEIGSFFIEGFAMGVKNSSDSAVKSVEKVGSNALSAFKEAVSNIDNYTDDLNMNPVITPILDLSDINNKKGQISSMFGNRSVKLGHSIGNSQSSDGYLGYNSNVNNFTFNQNNYSPKPLSRLDIYRQTRNQFAELKELVS